MACNGVVGTQRRSSSVNDIINRSDRDDGPCCDDGPGKFMPKGLGDF